MNIAFNINNLALEGFGATLSSLCRNCSDTAKLNFWFLCSEFKTDDRLNIKNLLVSENYAGNTEFIDFDAKAIFGNLRSLHGDWTPYGRLLIPTLIPADTTLYLDADLVILKDVLSLENFNFNGELLGAAFGCNVSWALDHKFFLDTLKWSPDTPYFNSGVVLFNSKLWRELNTDERWKKLAAGYPDKLVSHDQTLLNATCQGSFAQLGADLNDFWGPADRKPKYENPSIVHFIGLPKPWDLLGPVIHPGFITWKKYTTREWKSIYGGISLIKIARTWKTKKSLFNILIKKIRQFRHGADQ